MGTAQAAEGRRSEDANEAKGGESLTPLFVAEPAAYFFLPPFFFGAAFLVAFLAGM